MGDLVTERPQAAVSGDHLLRPRKLGTDAEGVDEMKASLDKTLARPLTAVVYVTDAHRVPWSRQ